MFMTCPQNSWSLQREEKVGHWQFSLALLEEMMIQSLEPPGVQGWRYPFCERLWKLGPFLMEIWWYTMRSMEFWGTNFRLKSGFLGSFTIASLEVNSFLSNSLVIRVNPARAVVESYLVSIIGLVSTTVFLVSCYYGYNHKSMKHHIIIHIYILYCFNQPLLQSIQHGLV